MSIDWRQKAGDFWEDFKSAADPADHDHAVEEMSDPIRHLANPMSTTPENGSPFDMFNEPSAAVNGYSSPRGVNDSKRSSSESQRPSPLVENEVASRATPHCSTPVHIIGKSEFESIDYHKPFPTMYLKYLHLSRLQQRRDDSLLSRIERGVRGRENAGWEGIPPDNKGGEEDGPIGMDGSTTMRDFLNKVSSYDVPQRNHILRWALHVIIAVAVALVAVAVLGLTEQLEEGRKHLLHKIIKEKFEGEWFLGIIVGYLFWVSSSAALVMVATAAVWFEPAAGGSGIPDVMSFLNGVMRPKVVNLKTFVAKSISCICSVGGGLPVGIEAPLIHLGAIVGAGVTQARSRTLGCQTGLFRSLQTNTDRRDFITAGAACGVSAAFGAPIGGLLFVMEEVASFWDHSRSGHVFLGTMICYTIIAFLNSITRSSTGYVGNGASVLFEVDIRIPLNITAVIPAFVLGGICGLAAGVFTKLNIMAIQFRRRYIRPNLKYRLLEPTAIVVVYVTVMYLLAIIPPCQDTDLPDTDATGSTSNAVHLGTENITLLNTVMCTKDGQYSPLGTLNLGMGKESIRHLFSRRTVNEFPAWSVAMFFIIYFTFASYTSGTHVSSGLVIPMLVMGASIGRIFGLFLVKSFTHGDSSSYRESESWMDPGVYALIGAGAFFGGITRLMLSICVIMVELSGDLHYLLPIMVAIVVSKAVADKIAKPLYHAQLHMDRVPFLPSTWEESTLEEYTAADVMSGELVVLREREYTSVILAALQTCSHHAFPVVTVPDEGPLESDNPLEGKFAGVVTREDIQLLLALPVLQQHHDEKLATHQVRDGRVLDLALDHLSTAAREVSQMTWGEWVEHQSSLFFTLGSGKRWHETWDDAYGLQEDKFANLPPVIDLSVIVNRSPYVVPLSFNLSLTYGLFRSIGLRHLVVVDGEVPAGIITRKDLLQFESKHSHGGDVQHSRALRQQRRSSTILQGSFGHSTTSSNTPLVSSSNTPNTTREKQQ